VKIRTAVRGFMIERIRASVTGAASDRCLAVSVNGIIMVSPNSEKLVV
jgi:hypothetical protein